MTHQRRCNCGHGPLQHGATVPHACTMEGCECKMYGWPLSDWGGARAGSGAPVRVPGGSVTKTASLSREQWDALNAEAKKLHITRSELLRRIVADYGFEP